MFEINKYCSNTLSRVDNCKKEGTPLFLVSEAIVRYPDISRNFAAVYDLTRCAPEGFREVQSEIEDYWNRTELDTYYTQLCDRTNVEMGDLLDILMEANGRRWDFTLDRDRELFFESMSRELDISIRILRFIIDRLREDSSFRLNLSDNPNNQDENKV